VRTQPAANESAVIELLKVLLRMISERHHVAAFRRRRNLLEHAWPPCPKARRYRGVQIKALSRCVRYHIKWTIALVAILGCLRAKRSAILITSRRSSLPEAVA
jgi:hypothetical protein